MQKKKRKPSLRLQNILVKDKASKKKIMTI